MERWQFLVLVFFSASARCTVSQPNIDSDEWETQGFSYTRSVVQEWIIILFYFMLLGALIVLETKCVWSFVFAACLCALLGSADLCCCMLPRIAQFLFLLAMFLHHWNCCIPQLMYEDPAAVRSGNDLRHKIELFLSNTFVSRQFRWQFHKRGFAGFAQKKYIFI